MKILNETGHKLGIECHLTYLITNTFIKAPFDVDYANCFIRFEADERLECIEEYLS
jgi:hypothetical protein